MHALSLVYWIAFSAAPALAAPTPVVVSGSAEGFAKGVTGGGSAAQVTPTTNAELISYLGDSLPRVIVLTRTFDFTGTAGATTATGCAPWGTSSACQKAINQNNWCTNYEPNAPKVSVTYDNAAIEGITVNSDKTILGVGSSGVIKGKGLRMANGVSNIIIQNIAITGLNPHYVWGGDAITLDGTDLIWLDHVTTSQIGRQHIVLGDSASNRVTISNCEIDGSATWSASCDAHHYWAIYLTGSQDLVTLKGNYIHHTSGRGPKVAGNTLLHAVNNYWYATSGHAFEVSTGAMIIAEGNAFQNVASPVLTPEDGGSLFTSPDANTNKACSQYLGRSCQLNAFGSSGAFDSVGGIDFFKNFQGKNIASAAVASNVPKAVAASAGVGKV
nr:putative pectin lyase b [Quercus suber]